MSGAADPPGEAFWATVADVVTQATQYRREYPGRKAFDVELDAADVTALQGGLQGRRRADVGGRRDQDG